MQYAFSRALAGRLLVKHFARKAPLAALALVVLMAAACGKRGLPLPPRERVDQRAEISAFQRGNQVVLSWKMPARNASPGSVLHIASVDIFRLAEPLNSPLPMTEEEFASRSVVIASMPITNADFGLKTITYRDTLEFAGQPVRLRYAIRYVNASGQRAGFSNFFMLEPAARVANAPASLSTTVSQDAITLSWTAPTQNVDATTPPNIIGYNVYRSSSAREAGKLLNSTPITVTTFADPTFEFAKEYFYFVRAVSGGTGGEPVESLESPIVNVKPVDTFPPRAPTSITIAATPTTISLFFPPNPETDVVGYRIYRSTDPNRTKSDWEQLTKDLQPTNTYIDNRVESGKTYYYYVTATDKFGNVSVPSEVVNETVP
ncbi:MAG: fibronectin type III domain-containing protein [Pyrinomonadaceae bacterium]